jgi:3-oxoacyl-[acyl-carrier protein] reductase
MKKTLVITGCSSGVGESIAIAFSQLGWNVIGISRDIVKLKALETRLDNFKFLQLDISNYSEVEDAFRSIEKIDVLVNNAAVFTAKPFIDCTAIEINSIIDTNLKGTMFCTLEAIKKIADGRIINIGSVSGIHGIQNQAIYSASKFGVAGFTESIAQECVKRVRFTTISPGGIDTPLWNDKNPYHGDKTRLLKPSNIAEAVKYIINLPENIVLKNMTIFPDNEWH